MRAVIYRLLFVPLLVGAIFLPVEKNVLAQESPSVLYVPLIGITSVPKPLSLAKGPGQVTYNYAVKNFLLEVALEGIQVVDDGCSSIKFVTGDDDGDQKLDYSETWRYECTTRISTTTHSTATATGIVNNTIAVDKASATVVVGSSNPPPLVSVINITKVAQPLSLPAQGGKITFTYKVNNPGQVPLSDVNISDNKCRNMSGKLGDVNGNNLLDINEVWIYTCVASLTETTTNTVTVTAFANGLKAVDNYTITVKVDVPAFPETGITSNLKVIVWTVLLGTLAVLVLLYYLTRKAKSGRGKKRR